MDFKELALSYHQNNGIGNGKIEVIPKVNTATREELSLAYTPGVAKPCLEIAEDETRTADYTIKGNTVFVVSDGSAVLGLGNIGARGSIPVMEGKALLFKIFGGIDAYPIVLDTQDSEKIIETVKLISPLAGGINLEDISGPRCFEIEERLSNELPIPIFHDDQHGTAVVCLAGLLNTFKITGKDKKSASIIVNGAGAAGIAITKLLLSAGFENITICDSKGAIYEGRASGMNPAKDEIAKVTNLAKKSGTLADVMIGADVFLGVSVKDAVSKEMVESMNDNAAIFAMANPDPEILPDDAISAGATIVATGRSDFPNQVNNVLGFPGIFRGLLDVGAQKVSTGMKIAAANAIADCVTDAERRDGVIIPSVFNFEVFAEEAEAVAQTAISEGLALRPVEKGVVYESTKKILEENRRRFFK